MLIVFVKILISKNDGLIIGFKCVMKISVGQSYPLGATPMRGGVNFCVFSKNSECVELLLYNQEDYNDPPTVIRLDPKVNKTFTYWHCFVPGIEPGQLYAYRVYGAYQPQNGLRFDSSKVLLDPYAKAVFYSSRYQRSAAIHPGDNSSQMMKSVVVDPREYHWEDDEPLRLPYKDTVIYEMHVGGFTSHPNSGLPESIRGTFQGVIEKIPYLKSLGITAVELMPIQQFDAQDAPSGLTNYWGYSPIAFFAPHRGYSSRKDAIGPVNEFRDMVKALHKAGIEVILDVVFNHTAEGDQNGPTLSFKGLENRVYYMLDQKDRSKYLNFSGCGNTINASNAITRRLIMDCLRYWVQVMHVDGFRFDLASVLARDEDGNPAKNPPILWEIESDPVLAGTKIIAEAWDAAGLYQVGSFIGHRWAEWNGQFRDDVRKFLRGDEGMVKTIANRILGSPDQYRQPDREPNRSINFFSCHDGFTLNDLISYNHKNNLSNLEYNRDGLNENYSWNCGVEGETENQEINALRSRQARNYFVMLLLAQGTPMITMGDEVRRTQRGNNNGYCQDNEISWFDWNLVAQSKDLLEFVKHLIQFTQQHQVFREEQFWAMSPEINTPRIAWHGVKLHQPDYSSPSHSIAFELFHPDQKERFYVAINAYWEPLTFEVPRLPVDQKWSLAIDTSIDFEQEAQSISKPTLMINSEISVQARSINILTASPS